MVTMTWAFWKAISLVGARTRTWGDWTRASTASNATTPNTSVLPVPDFDWITTSTRCAQIRILNRDRD